MDNAREFKFDLFKFDLTGASVGDWFLGCPKCWVQLETRTAANGTKYGCPECNGKMNIYDVTEDDITPQTI